MVLWWATKNKFLELQLLNEQAKTIQNNALVKKAAVETKAPALLVLIQSNFWADKQVISGNDFLI